MPSQTIKVLRIDTPGASLAAWLAAHHPDLFLAVFQRARAAQTAQTIQRKGLRGLGDDLSSFEPGLQEITVDTSSLVPASFVSEATDTGSSFLSSIGEGVTSAGSTVGSVLSSAGSSMLGALGSATSFLASKSGLTALTGLAQSYFTAQGQAANAQTAQAVLQTQVQRVAAGQTTAPITFTRTAAGNLVPVYSTRTAQGTLYQPLSAQGLASLTPSSFTVFLSQYGVWIIAAAAAFLVVPRLVGSNR